jgi:hypothetical protein
VLENPYADPHPLWSLARYDVRREIGAVDANGCVTRSLWWLVLAAAAGAGAGYYYKPKKKGRRRVGG